VDEEDEDGEGDVTLVDAAEDGKEEEDAIESYTPVPAGQKGKVCPLLLILPRGGS
jgi:hypothetical protein